MIQPPGSPWGICSGAEWSGEYPRFNIPAEDGWHEYTCTVDDANFVGGWG